MNRPSRRDSRFPATQPAPVAELARASAFAAWLEETARVAADPRASRLSTLSPSLMQDLMRFEQDGRCSGVVEAVAACIRHGRNLLIHLQWGERVLPLTVFPVEHLVHCPMPIAQLLALPLQELGVLHIEPALVRPPGHRVSALVGAAEQYGALAPVIWELAQRGPRAELLPEIAGQAAYRIAPGVDLRRLELEGELAVAVARLHRDTYNLREISGWPGFDRERAERMLNGLYLLAGLMVSRTHPAATNEGWGAGRT